MDSVQKLLCHFEKYEIQVQLPEDGKTVKLKVRPNDNIKCIRVHLVKQGVTSWKMVFLYKGQQLGENEKLEVKRIGNGSVLMLVRKGLGFGDQLRKGRQRRRGGNRGFLKW